MAEYKVVAKVVKAQGYCAANHKVGDEFEFGLHTPGGFCCHAFGAIWPTVNVLQNGGQYPWDRQPGISHWGCPDTRNQVMFKLERVEVPEVS